jgi:hypothetical protein
MTGNSIEIPILVATIGVIFGAFMLYAILGQLGKIITGLDRVTRANELIIDKLEAIVWQASETKKSLYSIDERVSRFSTNQHEQFVGELKEFLDENLVPLDKEND